MLIKQTAFSIIEILLAMAIFVILTASSIIIIISAFNSARLVKEEERAMGLASEGVAAIESLRDQSWDNLSNGSYGLLLNAGAWQLIASPDISGKFERTVSIEGINRDSNGDISPLGELDDNIKQISVDVEWDFTPERTKTISLQRYLTNWQESGSNSTGGGTPTPTSSPTPTPTLTPAPSSCAEYCQSLTNYSSGTCRQNTLKCNSNGETNEAGGDVYCTGGSSADTCCCAI